MRKSTIFFYIFFVSCIGGVSKKDSILDNFYEEKRKSMDIIDLIDTLVRQHKFGDTDTYTSGNWQELTNIKQINWAGMRDGRDRYYHSSFARQGKIYITMNGDFTDYMNGNRLEPVVWNVYLTGSHMGYDHIVLSNDVMSHNFGGFENYFEKKKVLLKSESYPCNPDYSGCSILKMNLNIRGKLVTVLEKQDGGGTAGPTYILFINNDGTDTPYLFPPSDKPIIKPAIKTKKKKTT